MSDMRHNEDSRVKIPALLHFLRLGYIYQSKVRSRIDTRNNIFLDVFKESLNRINSRVITEDQASEVINELSVLLDNSRDKGEHFYQRLVEYNKIKIIDLESPENNDFRVVSELTFNYNQEEFRPDITILINGIPLGFIEVKKPNNSRGMKAEFDRMKFRMSRPNFTQFFNQFQILGFTNNQDYEDTDLNKLQGSYYTTPNFNETRYNNFREEDEIPVSEFISEENMDNVLSDNNIMSIKETNEFKTNLKSSTFANRFITSVFSKSRLIYIIKYGIVYVHSNKDGLNKHIYRYPQFFACKSTSKLIEAGMKKGVIWHTQGSGKTALSYFLTNVLRDYYQKKGIITKFYFVVDRLDLLNQASEEFSNRGMNIANINSRFDFANNIKSAVIVQNINENEKNIGTMNVVNIQKFSEESAVKLELRHKIQRIYFLDEVHRGYKPKGTFLANLLGADKNGIFIGLTGTPLLREKVKTTRVFGKYIHKYYYNKSIADGYTLRIKKENISTKFRTEIIDSLGFNKTNKIPAKIWQDISKTTSFVNKVSDYISNDFDEFNRNFNPLGILDLGFMIVSSCSEQARLLKSWFDSNSRFNVALILYDEEDNKTKQNIFKGNFSDVSQKRLDGVIVFNMLLTGYDANRLKRLYLMRDIKEHNLLQTLARVNRPYKTMKYGYIVDFIDITEQYEETNERYLEELREGLIEDDLWDFTEVLVDVNKIKQKIKVLENRLFIYMGNIENNLEDFRVQIQFLNEKELREIKSQLTEYKECFNELRISHEDVSGIPIERISKALIETSNRLNLKITERILEGPNIDIDSIDYERLVFEFIRISEEELKFHSDEILEKVNSLKNLFSSNNDYEDPVYIDYLNEFKDIIKQFKDSRGKHAIVKIMKSLDILFIKIQKLNSLNTSLINKYSGDTSSMRVHKRLLESYSKNLDNSAVFDIMNVIMEVIDKNISNLGIPSEAVIRMRLRKPIKEVLKSHGINNVSVRMVDRIANLVIADKFRKD